MKQRPDGRFVKTITIDGKRQFFYSTEPTEKRAERDIQKQLLEFTKKKKELPFSEVASDWSSVHFETLEHNTLKQYKPALADVIEQFGNTPINSITATDIDRYIKSYAAKGFAQKTVKTRLMILNLIFKYAYINMIVEANPCLYITIPKNLPKEKRKSLTCDEIEKVKNSINATFGLFAYFLLYTGLRKGEALALTYSDIDFDAKLIHVNKTVEWIGNKPQIKNHTKTDAGMRDVPLLDILLPYISPPKKSLTKTLVFPNHNGELLRNAHFTRLWNKYREKTNLNITPHQIRHAYATMLFEKGIDVKTAQSLLGHANIQTTMDIYTHFSKNKLNDTVSLLNSLIN